MLFWRHLFFRQPCCSGSPESLMFHFPLHVGSPGLLSNPATASPAMQELEGRQVGGLVVEPYEAARPQQRHHLGGLGVVGGHVPGGGLNEILQAELVSAAGSRVFFGIGLLLCGNGVQTAS